MASKVLLALFAVASALPARLPSQQATVYAHLSDSIVHLPHGDSVEFQATGPAVVPNEPRGLLITYYPFVAINDSARLRAIALDFFRVLLPRLQPTPPWVVLQAVNVRAARRNQPGYYSIQQHGFVLQLHADGRWYFLNDTKPIEFH